MKDGDIEKDCYNFFSISNKRLGVELDRLVIHLDPSNKLVSLEIQEKMRKLSVGIFLEKEDLKKVINQLSWLYKMMEE
jgi:hypothetical protein